MKNFIKNNPNKAYFAMVFGWTWIIVFTLIFTKAVEDVNNPTPAFIIGGLLCNISPSIATFIVTRIAKGKEGVRSLKSRFMTKSPGRLYLLALAIVPSILVITTLISNFTIRKYEFGITLPLIIMGLVWPMVSGFGEEFGWRGFILPQLLQKYSPLKAGIILGVIWETWHLPMHYIGYKDYGVYMIPAFLVIGFINLTLQSVVMTNIFVRSKGSVRLMVLYHYTITSSAIILSGIFKVESLPRYTIYEGIVSVCIFLIAAAILYLKGGKKHESTVNC